MAGITNTQAVGAHVPGFVHGSPTGPADTDIQTWIDARWEEVNTILARRALPVPAPGGDGYSALELINRLGAATDLAAALSAKFSSGQPWPIVTNLRSDFLRMLQRLDDGEFDKLLLPTARTEDATPQLVADSGHTEIRRDMKF